MPELNRNTFRRSVVGFTTAFLAGAGLLASAGLAHAGDEPDHVGAPGRDGADVTCTSPSMSPMNLPLCNAVGQDGADGASGNRR